MERPREVGNNQLRKSPIDSFFDRDGEEVTANNHHACMHTRSEICLWSVEVGRGPWKNTQNLFLYVVSSSQRKFEEFAENAPFAKLKKAGP